MTNVLEQDETSHLEEQVLREMSRTLVVPQLLRPAIFLPSAPSLK